MNCEHKDYEIEAAALCDGLCPLCLKSEVERLWVELTAARDALRNDFEPDNQSRAWHRANKALEDHYRASNSLEVPDGQPS